MIKDIRMKDTSFLRILKKHEWRKFANNIQGGELAFKLAIKTSWNLYLIKITLIYSVLVNEIGSTIFIQLLLT